MTSVYVTPISTDPDAVAYQYHPNSWGQYFAMSFYDNPNVAKMIDEARSTSDWDKRAPLYAEIQKQIVADQPEVFGMVQNRRWAGVGMYRSTGGGRSSTGHRQRS